MPVTALKGIGAKTALSFQKAGIFTLEDLLHYFPRNYYRLEEPVSPHEAEDGMPASIAGIITGRPSLTHVRGLSIVTAKGMCEGEPFSLTWFHMPYLVKSLRAGVSLVFRGSVKRSGSSVKLVQPAVYEPEEYAAMSKTLQSVYPLVSGLKENTLKKALRQLFDEASKEEGEIPVCVKEMFREYLPEGMREEYHLAALPYAYEQIHFPKDEHALMLARNRMAFDEFLLFILALSSLKKNRETVQHSWMCTAFSDAEKVLAALPYSLTGAQMRVWSQIREELSEKKVMARLIQGDVGSGKTIVAFLAMISTAQNGHQAALMVPTEVLARQHFESLSELLKKSGLSMKTVLLTGSMKASERRNAYAEIADGSASLIIGTHALFQEKVSYNSLGLIVTDEQHRFGVLQRETLAKKGDVPHVLVMSATPIPRTLAIILYGDLDISVIDEMPADRIPIKNAVVDPSFREKSWRFIEKQVSAGHQAYVICPMVEESEFMEGENVEDYSRKLRSHLRPDICVGILHGQMKPDEKNEIMERFAAGEIHVLVSTTVVEVGVNVPNATVMMIENADHFGLAQLHQLRGRVGRGKDQSYCIFVASSGKAAESARLKTLAQSNDGFEIASKDLKLRGPGDLFGIRQSGILDFRVADVFQDAAVLSLAQEAAQRILVKDAALKRPEHSLLQGKLLRYTGENAGNLNI